jgi:hypothetical protein
VRAGADSYSWHPYGCRFCGAPKRSHGWRPSCTSPDHRWAAPHDWLILARMQIRRVDANRWIPPEDMRTAWRKWYGVSTGWDVT